MRIVFISDTHGCHRKIEIPDGDILVHAGDCMHRGKLEELHDLNAWFGKLPHTHKVLIPGNHDWALEQDYNLCKTMMSNCITLHEEAAEVCGLHFYGSAWSPRFCNWAFNADRGAQLKTIWSRIPDNTDVLVTHGPPSGVLDVVERGGSHEGCADLMERIQVIKPKIHAFGHIHEAYGKEVINGVTYVNASIMTLKYSPKNKPIVIDI
jgi:Icc-related predicted phosphoesterase